MSEGAPIYQKTRFSGRDSGLRSRLWRSEDHLLLVNSSGYAERYYRFYLADLQAVYMRRTTQGVWINLAAGVVGGVMLLSGLGFLSEGITGGFIGFVIAAVVFFAVMGVNMVTGPTIDCYIRTTSGITRIGAIDRLKKGAKFVEALHEWIDPIQGELPEDAESLYDALGGRPTPKAAAAKPTVPPIEPVSPPEMPTMTDFVVPPVPVEPTDAP